MCIVNDMLAGIAAQSRGRRLFEWMHENGWASKELSVLNLYFAIIGNKELGYSFITPMQ